MSAKKLYNKKKVNKLKKKKKRNNLKTDFKYIYN